MNTQIPLSEYIQRRQTLLSKCEPDSLVAIPAASLVTRSRDTEYQFRQDSYFWYLTGFNEPDGLLLLSNKDESEQGASYIFVPPKDKQAEIWQGKRLGVEQATTDLGVDQAFSLEELAELLPEFIDGHQHLYYCLDSHPHMDAEIQTAIATCKAAPKQSMIAPRSIYDVSQLLDEMRLIKSANEIAVMQIAADISVDAHLAAMKKAKSGIWEYQLEAIILHEFAMQGARFPAYNTIVGGGENACILHYTENNQVINDGDLVLIDAGCEYQGYAADITRTFPVNGKFSKPQADIYQLVLDAQLACIDYFGPGATLAEGMKIAVEIIAGGLLKLGILKGSLPEILENESWRNFFMHGLGHYLGLDVHDVGNYKKNGQDLPLQPGTVLTVEPGIYVSKDADVPDEYKGIGVRIEDNILITNKGNEVLTIGAVKEIAAIETLMQA
ncbi:Xaa-Pro aminopeptidase [Glaciecola sp. 1036]|uniref:Xaa-Pro aminopeptidase n=1 Tax=Alteromonadaceae TaxID=72275 RepID=UPI003CFD1465